MARREKDKKQTIEDLSEKVYNKILLLDEGTEISISDIVDELYRKQGYKYINLPIQSRDLFEVFSIVKNKLKNQIILDFSKHDGLPKGLPYNIPFIVRKIQI